MRLTFLILLFLSFIRCFSQDYDFEVLVKGTLEANKEAAEIHLKRELVYYYSSEHDKKGSFLMKKQFSPEGKLVTSRWLDEKRNKFVDTEYIYDSIGRLCKISSDINSEVFNYQAICISYDANNRISSLLYYSGPKAAVDYDTVKYFYNTKGKIDFKCYAYTKKDYDCIDTVTYFYDADQALLYTRERLQQQKSDPNSIPLGRSLFLSAGLGLIGAPYIILWSGPQKKPVTEIIRPNLDDCNKVVMSPDKKFYYELERDSSCNIIHWKIITDKKGKWETSEKGDRSYVNNKLSKEISYKNKATFPPTPVENFKYESGTSYEYGADGYINAIIHLKESGKVKRIEKYTREFY